MPLLDPYSSWQKKPPATPAGGYWNPWTPPTTPTPKSNVFQTPQTTGTGMTPYQMQAAAAAGAGRAANTASTGAGLLGQQQQQAQGTVMANAANTAQPSGYFFNGVSYATESDRNQAAAAAGAGRAAQAGSTAASQAGQQQQQAQGAAMSTAANTAAASSAAGIGLIPGTIPAPGSTGGLMGGPGPGMSMEDAMAAYRKSLGGGLGGAGMSDFMAQYMGDTHMPTVAEIQSNMNPFLDQIIDKGNRAIQSSAAARGLLGSSATLNNIGDWTTGAASQAYNDAEARITQNQRTKLDQGLAAWNMANGDRTFDSNQNLAAWNMANGDRNFISGRYDAGFNQNMTEKNFDANWTQWQNMFEADNYWKSADAYNNLMTAKEARDKGLASVGPDAAGKAVELTTGSASAIANLATSLATFKAMAAQGNGEANASAVDGIIGALTSFLGIKG